MMWTNGKHTLAGAACAAAIAMTHGMLSPPVEAAARGRTLIKIDSPVLVPGRTLQPGTYVFRVAQTMGSRNVVRIYDRDGQELLTTLLTIPTRRIDTSGHVVITFAKTPAGVPPAIKSYFYPGRQRGHMFVYPEEQAKKIASETKQIVVSTDVKAPDMDGWERAIFKKWNPDGTSTTWAENVDRKAKTAYATIIDGSGDTLGEANLKETPEGVSVRFDLEGTSAGTHAVHVHAVGRCEGPTFQSAGAHFNPTNKLHGTENPKGPHLGDLPNITVGTDEKVAQTLALKHTTLTTGAHRLLDADGAAIVLHQNADDYKTDPSGNSGPRVACGVITLPETETSTS